MDTKQQYRRRAKALAFPVIEPLESEPPREWSNINDIKDIEELKRVILVYDIIGDYEYAHKEYELNGNSQPYDDFIKNYSWDIFRICANMRNSKLGKYRRVNKRIYSMLGYCENPIFCTFTFDDDTLKNTNEETRRKYVRRFLKNCGCENYIANIDFGKENGREHYHAIVDRKILSKWSYGVSWYKKISPNDAIHKVKKYVVKYTLHALKSTTEKNGKIYRLIYSRTPSL